MTVLLENGAILEEFVLFSDEIHLQKKKVQYQSGESAGADKKRNFVQRRCFHDCITKKLYSICCKIFT